MILDYQGQHPQIGNNVFIAPTAVVIGQVTIGDNSSIWYGSVLRGDRDRIVIGANTNIQDNCTVHTDPGKPVHIGNRVSVGHGAVVHGCTLEDRCLVGIRAVVLNDACVRTGTIVGSGGVVREGQIVGPFQLVAGVPVKLKKTLDESVLERIVGTSQTYQMLAARHLELFEDPN
jgi:carbonic anhydrase/acetyltransferase-like protein (isoleucine patch superfamily)